MNPAEGQYLTISLKYLGNFSLFRTESTSICGPFKPKPILKHSLRYAEITSKKSRKPFFWPPGWSKITHRNAKASQHFTQNLNILGHVLTFRAKNTQKSGIWTRDKRYLISDTISSWRSVELWESTCGVVKGIEIFNLRSYRIWHQHFGGWPVEAIMKFPNDRYRVPMGVLYSCTQINWVSRDVT